MRTLILCPLVLVALTCLAQAAAAGEPTAPVKPVVLFLPNPIPPLSERNASELAAEGFVVAKRYPSDPLRHTFEDLTPEYLRQFHTVVVLNLSYEPTERDLAGFKALLDYVKSGGGMLITNSAYQLAARNAYKHLLDPLAVEMLCEQIVEKQNLYTALSNGLTLAWTDQIVPHPVTQGVTGLAYDICRLEPGDPFVTPVKPLDGAWQVLIKAMSTAHTELPVPSSLDRSANTGPGTYKESPPLLAVREYGLGRVAVWPMYPSHTFLDGYSVMLDHGIVMKSQRGEKRSDGAKLAYNLLRWLSEPSRSIATFGHYTPPTPPPSAPDLGFQPFDWNTLNNFGPIFAHDYLGLIGPRTGLSTGEGLPEEFIAEAQKAGYDFIAFCEDINNMSRENWDKLVEACRKATTDKFLALPGYYFLDNENDAFVVPGITQYPSPDWADPKDPGKKILYSGTIRMSVSPIMPTILLPLKSNTRPPRYHCSVFGYAYQVWEDGKLVVEDWPSYVEMQKEELRLFPTSVHLLKKPSEVAGARQQGMQAYVRADSLAKLMESIDDYSLARGLWYKPAYVSTGPEMAYFTAENWGTTDLTIPGSDRIRLQMLVRSAVGLKDVQVFDRGRMIRRYLPHGAKEFKQTLDQYHSQQRSFLLVATDTAGGRAISWARNTNAQECWFIMCSDNMNDMGPGGKIMMDRGSVTLGGTEFTITPYGPGSIWPWPGLYAKPADGSPAVDISYRAAMKDCSLVSRFGIVVNYPVEYYWDGPGTIGIAYPAPLKVNPYMEGTYRSYQFVRRPPGPDLEIREYAITIKQDMKVIESPAVCLLPGSNWNLKEGMLDHIAYFNTRGNLVVEKPDLDTGPQRYEMNVQPGQYAAIFPMCTAVFPLDQPLTVNVTRNPVSPCSTVMQAGLNVQGDTLAKGTTYRARFAVLSLPYSPEGQYTWMPRYKRGWNSNLVAEEVRSTMGLTGSPAYTVKPVVGSVQSTQLALRLRTERHGFRGTISQTHLPIPLPVFVEGLNPNWSAGIWYKGQQTLLQVEWPSGYFENKPVHRKYVQARQKTDEIIRIGTFDDGVGYLQLDTEVGDKDVFIGNLVTCDHDEFGLTMHRDLKTGKATVELHNPTDTDGQATVIPAPGFDLYGDFRKTVAVPAGSSVMVDLP
ncbi:MAG: hypothetical protein IT440_09550 [Phycisphaeraceae bacterium]|nr:hypothetical protein [Phycisphaeraceae bacterium]